MAVTSLWNKRTKLSVSRSYVPTDQTDFPVALVWNGSSGNLPVEVYNNSNLSPQTDGRDIRFTLDSLGNNELPFEIVTFSPNTIVSNARVEIYVKAPVLYSSQDTTFFMWWGNPDATAYGVTDVYGRNNVWSSYIAVYHLDNFVNATGNSSYDGTNYGTDATFTPLGTARFFNMSESDYIGISGLVGSPSNISIFSYIYPMGSDTFGCEVFSIGDYVAIRTTSTQVVGFYRYASGWNNTILSQNPLNAYHTISYVCSPSNSLQRTFLDTTRTDTTYTDAISYSGQGSGTFIGRHGNGSPDFDFTGIIDEVRIDNRVRSIDWVTATHNSIANFSNFVYNNGTNIVTSLPNRGWNRMVRFTVNKSYVPSDQTNFPIMLIWNGSTGNLPAEVYNNSSLSPKSDGRDIRFSLDFAGNIELPFEIVTFSPNSNTANARAEIYVRLYNLYSATDTTFYMWWGHGTASAYESTDTYGANNVWVNNYIGVYHLNDATEKTALNSVGQYHGTYDGTSFPNRVDTPYGYGQTFVNANSNNVLIGTGTLLDITGNMSISAIIKVTSFTADWQAIVAKGDSAYRLHRASNTNFLSFGRTTASGNIDATNNVSVNDGKYHHVIGVFNTSTGAQLFTDGTSGALYDSTLTTQTNSLNLCIGRNSSFMPSRDWNGDILEVRIAKTFRSSSWITSEYNSLMNSSSFISYNYVNNVDFSEIGCNF